MKSNQSGLFSALRLADSFLPVGTYSNSYGLESFIRRGVVDTSTELQTMLEDYLRHRVGPCDMVALSTVYSANDESDIERIVDVDNRYHSMQLASESRKSSKMSGNQLLELMSDTAEIELLSEFETAVDNGQAHGHYPIVLGMVASERVIGEREACLVHGYSFASGLLGAAQRVIGLGHTEVQATLQELEPVVMEAVEIGIDREAEEMRSFAPLISYMGMNHERDEVRLFVS